MTLTFMERLAKGRWYLFWVKADAAGNLLIQNVSPRTATSPVLAHDGLYFLHDESEEIVGLQLEARLPANVTADAETTETVE